MKKEYLEIGRKKYFYDKIESVEIIEKQPIFSLVVIILFSSTIILPSFFGLYTIGKVTMFILFFIIATVSFFGFKKLYLLKINSKTASISYKKEDLIEIKNKIIKNTK